MSNELVVHQSLTPTTWNMIKEIAPAMQQSRLFGVTSPEAAMAIMLKGYELGMSLTAAFEFIHVINGKPGLSPRGALALVLQSPNFDDMKITESDGKCTVWMRRKNGVEYEATYTRDDADKAGLIKKDSGWEKYEPNMLRWRTIGYCIDVVFPDVIGGMKRSDELGAEITPEGDLSVVDITPVKPELKPVVIERTPAIKPEIIVETPEINEPQEKIPNYGYTLQSLMETIDMDEIFALTNNEVPTTNEQVNQVVHQLVLAGKIEAKENGKPGA